jgi:hypothetical protein
VIEALPDPFARDHDRLARPQREATVLTSPNRPGIRAIDCFERTCGHHDMILDCLRAEIRAEWLAGQL